MQKNMKRISKYLLALSALTVITAFSCAAQNVRTVEKDGTVVINTTEIGEDFIGHHAPTPVEIRIVKGKITDIKALESDETPSYYEKAVTILKSFIGMTVKEAKEAKVDAVTGCTMSCNALIDNVKEGLKYADGDKIKVLE